MHDYNICNMGHIETRKIADTHKALADPMRIMILRLLLERELCVCEIVRSLEEPQYKVSKHISVLKQAGLVRDWREGTWIHYEIAPDLDPEWKAALQSLRKVWDKSRDVQAALWRLQQKVTRGPGGVVTSCECITSA
jgi:ArsR family transcriptional regulator, arsenate/arsenite/antimonite-responsive transcriptional repressor